MTKFEDMDPLPAAREMMAKLRQEIAEAEDACHRDNMRFAEDERSWCERHPEEVSWGPDDRIRDYSNQRWRAMRGQTAPLRATVEHLSRLMIDVSMPGVVIIRPAKPGEP